MLIRREEAALGFQFARVRFLSVKVLESVFRPGRRSRLHRRMWTKGFVLGRICYRENSVGNGLKISIVSANKRAALKEARYAQRGP